MKKILTPLIFLLISCREQRYGKLDLDSFLFFIGIIITLIVLVMIIQKGLKLKSIVLIILSLSIVVYSRIDKIVEEYIIVPQDFRGNVTIIYDFPCGSEPLKLDNSVKSYSLDTNGLFITNETHQCNLNHRKHFIITDNQKIELINMSDSVLKGNWMSDTSDYYNPSRFKLGYFNLACGYKPDLGYNMQSAFIGSYNEMIDSINEQSFYIREKQNIELLISNCK